MKHLYSKSKSLVLGIIIATTGLFAQQSSLPSNTHTSFYVTGNVQGKQVPVQIHLEKVTAQQAKETGVVVLNNNSIKENKSDDRPAILGVPTSSNPSLAAGVCDSITNILPQDLITTISYTGPIGTGTATGFLGGTGTRTSNKYAEEFNATGSSATHIQYFSIIFTRASASTTTGEFSLVVWNKNGSAPGEPTSVLASIDLKYKTIQDAIAAQGGGLIRVWYSFATPIAIPASKSFFIGTDCGQIATDTLAIGVAGDTTGNKAWSNVTGSWKKVKDTFTWTTGPDSGKPAHTRTWMTVGVTDVPVTIAPTTSADTICVGGSVQYNVGGTNVASYQWTFGGGSISSSTATNPNVTYANPGYYFYNIQGVNSCGFSHSLFGNIQVDSLPPVAIAAPTSICSGSTVQLTATGADSYSWSGGVSGTTDTVSVTPTTNTTYSVTGTGSGTGCVKTVAKTVNLVPTPTAGFSYSITDTVCPDVNYLFDGTVSLNEASYEWSFTSGTPTSSTVSNPAVAYSTTGLLDVKLKVDNGCGQLDSMTQQILVPACINVGIAETVSPQFISIYNNTSNALWLQLNEKFSGQYIVGLYNNLGQLVSSEVINTNPNSNHNIQLPDVDNGIYYIRLSNAQQAFTNKLLIQ